MSWDVTCTSCHTPRWFYKILPPVFDTIDHEILLERLRVSGGVCGTALVWFRSYLAGRSQSVRIHNTTSKPRLLSYSVPQGSALGPLLFTLYYAPIASIVRWHGLIAHLYVEGTQLYIMLDQDDATETIKRIEACIMEIKEWMADEKTLSLLLVLLCRCQVPLSSISEIIIADNNITPYPSARNLGGGACQQCLPLFFLPSAQHQQHSKSAGCEDSCHHCPGPSHFPTWLLQLFAIWTPICTHTEVISRGC